MFKFSYQPQKSSPAILVTKDLFDEAINDPRVALICRRISEQSLGLSSQDDSLKKLAQEKISALKATLPAFCWHATFKDNKRNAKNSIPSGLVMLDVDHIENPEQTFNQIKDKALTLNLVAAHITPSTKGLRLVFIIPQGMTIPDAQSYLAQQLNLDNIDACVKDLSRISYLVPRDYWLYINYDALFSDTFTATPGTDGACSVSQQNPQRISRSDRPDTPNASVNEPSVPSGSPEGSQSYPTDYKGIPYAKIVSNLEFIFGGKPVHGSRNSHIYMMAGALRTICDDDPVWIEQILPTYGEAESKWRATIRSACQKQISHKIPDQLQMAIDMEASQMQSPQSQTKSSSSIITAELPPEMPKKLPRLIAHVTSKVPETHRPALSSSVFPALATYLHDTKFPLIDGTLREPILMAILMAPQSSGKSCINVPNEYIMAQITAQDKINRQKEQDWKDAYNAKANSKEKPKRPDDLVVQKLAPDITNAALVRDLQDNKGKSVYSIMEEIEMLLQIKDWSKIVRLSFDAGEYGQERVGTQSVCALVRMRWNFVACTTILRGLPFFSKNLLDGTLSRMDFSTIIPDPNVPYLIKEYNDEYAEKLKPYITNLSLASGEIGCPKALALARSLQQRCLEMCAMADDDVMTDFIYRAVTIAYTKAMILYIAQDMTWDKTIEDFMEWSLYYDLWCKNHFFGVQLAEAAALANAITHRGKANLLDLLPDTFSKKQAEEVRRSKGMKPDPTQMLYNWVHRKFIIFNDTTQLYEKTSKYKLRT